MNLHNITTEGLLLLHNAIRKALEEDDSLPENQKKYEVRSFSDWRKWADEIESELTKRDISYNAIQW